MPRYWLMKSEPSVFSIDDLSRAKDGTTRWDGVRNYQARNFLRNDMAVGDGVLFYHSSAEPPAVAGTARVVRAGYPDPTQFDPRDGHFDRDSLARRPALVRGRHQVRSEVRPPGDAAPTCAARARSRRWCCCAGETGCRCSRSPPANGSRSSRWARAHERSRAAHARHPPRRDPGARSRRDGGVLRRRARAAGAAALAGRRRRTFDLVRPGRRRLPGRRARRRRAATPRRLEHRRPRHPPGRARHRARRARRLGGAPHRGRRAHRPPHRLHPLRARSRRQPRRPVALARRGNRIETA